MAPTKDEIADVENEATENIDEGTSKFRGMSYEEGVVATLRWMNGDTDENPMAD